MLHARNERLIFLKDDIDFEVQHALWGVRDRENSSEIERDFGQLSGSRTSNQTRQSLEAQLLEPQLFSRSHPTIAESIRTRVLPLIRFSVVFVPSETENIRSTMRFRFEISRSSE